jgi:hypothetical protein
LVDRRLCTAVCAHNLCVHISCLLHSRRPGVPELPECCSETGAAKLEPGMRIHPNNN